MRFAHFADIHLGYGRSDALADLERRVFTDSISRCISDDVDFVLMCGDIFHTNIPEMRVQKMAMEQLRRLHDAGIPVYAVYGSHDFSPIDNSVIDLVVSAGYMIKPPLTSLESGDISLGFVKDSKTGVRIAGIGGLKTGRDRDYYDALAREPSESEQGLCIFLFHCGITEMINTIGDEGMPLSLLPGGFDYYAGGHLHKYQDRHFPGYANVVYPGALFAGHPSDMENSANGERRGFVMVEFDHDIIKSVDFIEMTACGYRLIDVDANTKSSEYVRNEITTEMSKIPVNNKVVILKVYGELARGRTTDVDTGMIRRQLLDDGAIDVVMHMRDFTSKEYAIRGDSMGTVQEIETNTFKDNIKQVNLKRNNLTGEQGVRLAQSILSATRKARLANEKSNDYNGRITSEVLSHMDISDGGVS
ncbi:MAG: DNA repair exonuclease [Cenarchaeum sp. SB0661_bin_35]|nr:DNA repair exonuclease [Cenarchaeum sp. SB0667_bin_13]MYC79689.1 DNA repair exonuclease [Cenarchaeum sp. SB0661_bin_35]MYI52136.1 DNA repair exonuclease [Cenarchaeum sp. SB0673_bin_9]